MSLRQRYFLTVMTSPTAVPAAVAAAQHPEAGIMRFAEKIEPIF